MRWSWTKTLILSSCVMHSGEGVRITTDSQLEDAFEKAIKHKGPFYWSVVDPDESTLIYDHTCKRIYSLYY